MLSSLAVSWLIDGKPSVFYTMNGGLGVLVALTAGCDVLSIQEAVAVGALGGLIVFFGDKWLERLRIDDTVGAVPVHFFSGLWGLVSVALFGLDQLEPGRGFTEHLAVQSAGIAVLLGYCVALPLLLLRGLNKLVPLRVTQHIETIGLKIGEHGANSGLNELFDLCNVRLASATCQFVRRNRHLSKLDR